MMQNAAAPQLPGSMAGAPSGPGGAAIAAPGAGAGNEAAAIASMKGIFPQFYKVLAAFPAGSENWTHISKAMESIAKVIGDSHQDSLVPSAIQQMAMAAKGGPLKAAPPVGIAPAAPPQGAQPQAE